MEKRSSFQSALTSAGIVTTILLASFLYLWRTFPIPDIYLRSILLGVALFTIGLVAVVIYQSHRIYESAHSLAKGMTKDMLTYSHELFSELYRSSPVPYILIDKQGVIESINFSTARLFHVEIDALDGLTVFDFITGDDPDKVALIPEYFKQGKFVNSADARVTRPDGITRDVLLSLFSFVDGKSEKKGLLTLVDITKQKQVDKAKTEFVSLASHQLRTPISTMKWNVELLETSAKQKGDETLLGYASKIAHGLERMDLLVSDFLSVSKLELGTLVAKRAPLALRTYIEEVAGEHRAFAENKHIEMELNLDSLPDTVESDSHLLHMIVSNLISNAVKYTRDGGTITITGEDTGTGFTITIEDSGIGIPLDNQEMIFSKLFRAENARSQVTDGTGLGLYIVKEAVEILGGTISFTSKEGVGTTFVVALPK